MPGFAYLCLMILVTGATGLVGSHLLFSLIHKGEKVKILLRENSSTDKILRTFRFYHPQPQDLMKNVIIARGDITDPESLYHALEDIDQVYHCAAVVSFDPSERQRMIRTNAGGTALLVNLCLEKGVRKLCHVSSIAALGGNPGPDGMNEENLFDPPLKPSGYAKSKFQSEREVWRGTEEGLPAVIVNPSVILGPGDWSQGSSGLFGMVHKGLKYYSEGITGYVDVRDVAEIMIRLMQSPAENERFVLNAGHLSYRELFEQIAVCLGKPAPKIRVSKAMAAVIWRLATFSSFLSGKKSAITRETAHSALQKYFYSSAKIRERLGYDFISPAQSIQDTALLFLKENPAGSL